MEDDALLTLPLLRILHGYGMLQALEYLALMYHVAGYRRGRKISLSAGFAALVRSTLNNVKSRDGAKN